MEKMESGPAASAKSGTAIDWSPRAARRLACLACGEEGEQSFVLSAAMKAARNGAIDVYRCPACESLNIEGLTPIDYAQSNLKPHALETYRRLYVEAAANLRYLAEIFCSHDFGEIDRFLDVGCGFGFSTDMARARYGCEVLAIDPSPLAREGAKLLDLPLLADVFPPKETPIPGTFDLVFGGDIIEHLSDPQSFLQDLRACVSSEGSLVLHTPDAQRIGPDVPEGECLAILSPGAHTVVFSENGLRRALQAAGFANIDIRREGELKAVASNGPLRPRSQDPNEFLLAYLPSRMEELSSHAGLFEGFAARLAFMQLNRKAYASCADWTERLFESYARHYGLTGATPAELVRAVRNRPAADLPFSLPASAYVAMEVCAHFKLPHEVVANFATLCHESARTILDHIESYGYRQPYMANLAMMARCREILSLARARPEDARRAAKALVAGLEPRDRDRMWIIQRHLGNMIDQHDMVGD